MDKWEIAMSDSFKMRECGFSQESAEDIAIFLMFDTPECALNYLRNKGSPTYASRTRVYPAY